MGNRHGKTATLRMHEAVDAMLRARARVNLRGALSDWRNEARERQGRDRDMKTGTKGAAR
jgi:hypothetical protein